MTTDTVFAIFSTTKAITGTAVLQCVEEGKLDLDAPAKNLRARYRQAAGDRRASTGRGAEAARTQARHHHAHADAAHRRLRLRLLQPELQPPRAGERAAERHHGVEGVDDDAAAVRSRREMGIRQQHRLVRPGRRGRSRGKRLGEVCRSASSSRSACATRPSALRRRCALGSQACTSAKPTAR